jgi:hypothetical protein
MFIISKALNLTHFQQSSRYLIWNGFFSLKLLLLANANGMDKGQYISRQRPDGFFI